MKYFLIFLILIGFSGIVFGEESSNPPIPEPEQDTSVSKKCGPGTTYQDGICVVNETENSVKSESNRWGGPILNYDTKSPLKQFRLGASIEKIQCKENLVLIQKYDGSPACIKPQNKQKLIERGWANSNQSITDSNQKGQTSIDKKIDAVIIGQTWPTGGILRYEKTVPVIDDTYLLHSVKYWQEVPREVLEFEHSIHGDEFYMELGRLLVKNEMTLQLQTLGIENANNDFKVYDGAVEESLPPHIYYDAIVNSTDGKTYLLEGASHANQVNYHSTKELKFHDTSKQFSISDVLTDPKITILPEDGYRQHQNPKFVIVDLSDSEVSFFNDSPVTVRIQESGTGKISEEHELTWIGPILKPTQWGHVTFNSTGLYEWDVRTSPEQDYPDWWGSYGGGTVLVLSDEVNQLPVKERIKMAGTIVMESEIPISGLGMGKSDGLHVYLKQAINEMHPSSKLYYENRIKQIMPFDVNVLID